MKRNRLAWAAALLLPFLASACASGLPCPGRGPSPGASATREVALTILQLNDIYEITPVSGGKEGGLARVATLRKELLAENPNTLTVLAGDLFSPSALGTAKVGGERLQGKQIVATMNQLGLDYATFGNHEFDVKESAFLDRLKESRFTWVSSNVFDKRRMRFPGVLENRIVELPGPGGATVRVGLFGLTIGSNPAGYATYGDVVETARAQVAALRERADILIALTHLSAADDVALAQAVPGIDLILGGHEHENMQLWRGAAYVPIFKADANARTVYIHRLIYDTDRRLLTVRSVLRRVTAEIPEDPATLAEVRHWQELGFAAFRAEGFEPEQLVATVPLALDGLEASVRNRSTELTRLIAASLLAAVPDAELALFNSGAIRIDDLLPPGPLTQFDIIRILPFGGKVCRAEIDGALLLRVLDQGLANRGQGGFLQGAGVTRDDGGWRVNGAALEESRAYRMATNDFLVSGREQGLEFLSDKNPALRVDCRENTDVRFALRDYLRRTYGAR